LPSFFIKVADKDTMSHTMKTAAAFLALALALAAPLCAQTMYVAVREASAGAALPAPTPAREGLESGLFAGGIIVLGLVNGTGGGPAQMAAAARAAGAETVLQLQVDYRDPPRGGAVAEISGSARFTLLDAATGAQRFSGTEAADNKGREKPLGRQEMGREIGARVAARVIEFLGGGTAAQ
jgi:hypothetical protein